MSFYKFFKNSSMLGDCSREVKWSMPFILLICFMISCTSQGTLVSDNHKSGGHENVVSDSITVHPNHPIYPIKSTFWGANFLYWKFDDAKLSHGLIEDRLKAMGIKLLRYPGGTVADNYHWETNSLNNVNMYPYVKDTTSTINFNEFMKVCRLVGAQPDLVVNVRSWAVKDSIQAGAHEAADWLRYCKRKGYHVKYWEIGNETYWHPFLTAKEYANVVNIYADSLKKVDPNIFIGVNGHWDINFVGTKERLEKGVYSHILKLYKHINSKNDYKNFKSYYKNHVEKPYTKGSPKWWPTVARLAGNNVNMIVVHTYFSPTWLGRLKKELSKIKNLFTDMYPNKKFLYYISEYNVWKRQSFKHGGYLALTEAVGKMLGAGVNMAALWPIRMKVGHWLPLLEYGTNKPSIVYKIYQRLSQVLKGSLVLSTTNSNKISAAYTSCNDTSCTVVITGRFVDKPTQVAVTFKGMQRKFNSLTIWRIRGKRFQYTIKKHTLSFGPNKKGVTITVNPTDVVIATFK